MDLWILGKLECVQIINEVFTIASYLRRDSGRDKAGVLRRQNFNWRQSGGYHPNESKYLSSSRSSR